MGEEEDECPRGGADPGIGPLYRMAGVSHCLVTVAAAQPELPSGMLAIRDSPVARNGHPQVQLYY